MSQPSIDMLAKFKGTRIKAVKANQSNEIRLMVLEGAGYAKYHMHQCHIHVRGCNMASLQPHMPIASGMSTQTIATRATGANDVHERLVYKHILGSRLKGACKAGHACDAGCCNARLIRLLSTLMRSPRGLWC